LKGMEDRDEEEFFEVCEGTMFTVPAHNHYMLKNDSLDTVVLHYVFLTSSDALDPSQARSVFEKWDITCDGGLSPGINIDDAI
ncbi:unnamed protein product, partial [Cyprideis torosa]